MLAESDAARAGRPRFRFDVAATLAVLTAADVVVLVADVSRGKEACIDADGDLILTALRAAGVPSMVGVVAGAPAPRSSAGARATLNEEQHQEIR